MLGISPLARFLWATVYINIPPKYGRFFPIWVNLGQLSLSLKECLQRRVSLKVYRRFAIAPYSIDNFVETRK